MVLREHESLSAAGPLTAHATATPYTSMGQPVRFNDSSDAVRFAMESQARESGPLQFIREFTQNGLEATALLPGEGLVHWTQDTFSKILENMAPKLCVYDTGCGMSADELQDNMRLFASGKSQGLTGNFGVGAKTSAITRNPNGLIYTSLKDGKVSRVKFYLEGSEFVYAILPAGIGELPHRLRASGHGTMVTFLGESDDHDTTQRPAGSDGLVGSGKDWLKEYLNTRYFSFGRFCAIVEADRQASGGSGHSSKKVEGAKSLLDGRSSSQGRVEVSVEQGAFTAHWWVVDAKKVTGSETGRVKGHVAAVFQDEIYEASPRNSYSRVRECGITFGAQHVVIYFEPSSSMECSANLARTRLTVGGEGGAELPWERLCHEFRDNLPQQLKDFVKAEQPSSAEDSNEFKKREQSILDLYNRLDIKRLAKGSDPGVAGTGGVPGSGGSGASGGQGGTGSSGNGHPDRSSAGTEAGGRRVPTKKLPTVVTYNKLDELPEDLLDYVAMYDRGKDIVHANLQFYLLAKLVSDWEVRIGRRIGANEAILGAVREEVKLILIEAVFSVLTLDAAKVTGWSRSTREEALSQASLTTAVVAQLKRIDDAVSRRTRDLKNSPEGE
jgi:hypothetical protein